MRNQTNILKFGVYAVLAVLAAFPVHGGKGIVSPVSVHAEDAQVGRWNAVAVSPGYPSTAGAVVWNTLRSRVPYFPDLGGLLVSSEAKADARNAEAAAASVAASMTDSGDDYLTSIWTHGGDSGGLVMALAGIDARTDGDLSAGLTIVATGAVDSYGNVRPVGMVDDKTRGAVRENATVLFVPTENLWEAESALRADDKLFVVGVSHVSEAIEYLCKWGSTSELCKK